MSNYNENILVAVEDAHIRKFVCHSLQARGFRFVAAGTGSLALNLLVSEPVDLIIIDLILPDMKGTDIITKIREWSEIPIIVISVHELDKENAEALDLGADDYLTKPFSATELLARIRVALRHFYKQNSVNTRMCLKVEGLSIDFSKSMVYLDGVQLHTTPMEYSLLALLFKNMGKVLTTQYIINEIWGVGYGNDTQALRALMSGLRHKIEKNPAKPRYIITETGVGYRLTDE
mgnify:CR=1 FL=1